MALLANRGIEMKRCIAILVNLSITALAANQYLCAKPEPGDTTHWVGNQDQVFVERKTYRALKGAVFAPDGTRVAEP